MELTSKSPNRQSTSAGKTARTRIVLASLRIKKSPLLRGLNLLLLFTLSLLFGFLALLTLTGFMTLLFSLDSTDNFGVDFTVFGYGLWLLFTTMGFVLLFELFFLFLIQASLFGKTGIHFFILGLGVLAFHK
jgi:hypothetical protein